MKRCSKDLHDFTGRRCQECRRIRDRATYSNNIERHRSLTRKWKANNPDKVAASARRYREENREEVLERKRVYREQNAEKVKQAKRLWQRENAANVNARVAKRKAIKKQARPKWLTAEQDAQILSFYKRAVEISRETGVKMHVDHIHPLQGENSCGLHVPWNLQIIPAIENLKKGNKII